MDDFLANLDPDDVAEIEAAAERVESEGNQRGIYIKMMFPEEAALEFLATLDDATEGNMMAMFKLMSFTTMIGEQLYEALNGDDDD